MQDTELLAKDLTEQLSLIANKTISVNELIALQLRATQLVNPKINAFISIDQQITGREFQSGSLAGINLAIKDNIDVDGFNTTAGLLVRKNQAAKQDAFVIEKLRQAGARFGGKLNMHEGALGASNHNSHYGDCFNPHDFQRTPGGSSGGSGAAVASGLASAALGTDTMGSVRIPASYCGVFGFKASRGAISNRGSVVCSQLMDNIGPMTRSARDLTLLFNLMNGVDIESADSQKIQFNHACSTTPVILVPDNLALLGVDASIVDDFERNIKVFETLGCKIESFTFDHDFGAARRAGLILCEADMRVEHQKAWQEQPEHFSKYLAGLLAYIDTKTPMDVIRAQRVLDSAVIKARKLFETADFILMPTTPQSAFKMSEQVPANQADLTSFANQAGICALSMPMITSHQLPAGMQLLGKHGDDYRVLALAERWQQASGFSFELPAPITELFAGK